MAFQAVTVGGADSTSDKLDLSSVARIAEGEAYLPPCTPVRSGWRPGISEFVAKYTIMRCCPVTPFRALILSVNLSVPREL